ncbi:hypothetical protein Poly30_31370 [Planctomycetes bacterium Poly30]|uniref:Uncharacterized protein n=1 Tax=Saltatorellus ferox TaxID=2528018 RepID=A0A518EU43_9BACT|nr:hypothetical protein Poly30_31370 [Planctomycetes bacterium Poly30]
MELKEILKFVFVFASLPWVLPFLKALVKDLLQAFEEDGGLLGERPSQTDLEKIRERKRREPSPLVNEPLAHVKKAMSQQSQNRSGGPGATSRR